jgi:hypothetical protein
LKRLSIALIGVAVLSASTLAGLAAAIPGANPLEAWNAVTRPYALHAAKAESAAWLAYWKKQEPVRETRSTSNGYSVEITEDTDFEVVSVGPCEKANVAPMFCRQKVSVTYRQAFEEGGQPSPIEHVQKECTVVDLRIGSRPYAAHRSRKPAHFNKPGLRSKFDVPLKGWGFVTVEAPPEFGSCGREKIK